MSPLAYALLCVVVPMAWGLVVVWVSNAIERFVVRRRKGTAKELPPTEYHI